MKKIMLFIAILSLLFVQADDTSNKMIQLTLINKTTLPVGVSLVSRTKDGRLYYLPVPLGTKEEPSQRTYSIIADHYLMQLKYVQTYDPVYGWKCSFQMPPKDVLAYHNLRIVFLPCENLITVGTGKSLKRLLGEPGYRKYMPFSPTFPNYVPKWKIFKFHYIY